MLDNEQTSCAEVVNFEEDLKYIEKDILAKQRNNNYIKFSRLLGEVAIIDMTQSQYINYWTSKYKNAKQEHLNQIIDACNRKFIEGLISPEEMKTLIIKSKDTTKEKQKALEYLGI